MNDTEGKPNGPSVETRGEAVKAALLSAFVVPGAGQFYNREWGKGIFLALVFSLSSLGVLIPVTYAVILYFVSFNTGADGLPAGENPLLMLAEKKVTLITLVAVSVILYLYSIIDAYTTRLKTPH